MKSKAIIAGIVATSLIATGVGYAFWSDTTTFATTATTGELDVQFVEGVDTGVDIDGMGADGAYNYDEDAMGALNPVFAIEDGGKSISVTIDDIYPGYYTNYYVEVENTGTVPARLENITIDALDIPEGMGNLAQVIVQGNNSQFTAQSRLNDAEIAPNAEVILESGETEVIIFTLQLNSGINGDQFENDDIQFNVDLNWTQFNDTL